MGKDTRKFQFQWLVKGQITTVKRLQSWFLCKSPFPRLDHEVDCPLQQKYMLVSVFSGIFKHITQLDKAERGIANGRAVQGLGCFFIEKCKATTRVLSGRKDLSTRASRSTPQTTPRTTLTDYPKGWFPYDRRRSRIAHRRKFCDRLQSYGNTLLRSPAILRSSAIVCDPAIIWKPKVCDLRSKCIP